MRHPKIIRVILTDPKKFTEAINAAKHINRNIRNYNQGRILRQKLEAPDNSQHYKNFRTSLSTEIHQLPTNNLDLYNKIIKPLNQLLIVAGNL